MEAYPMYIMLRKETILMKYTPTFDDMYSTKLCFICGRDVINDEADTCSDLCAQQKQIFDENWEEYMLENYEGEEDDWGGAP